MLDTTLPPAAATAPPAQSLRRAAYLTSGLGLVHAVLFLLAYWLAFVAPTELDGPLGASYSKLLEGRSVLIGLYLMPFAGISFIWFIVALRMWVTGHARPVNLLFSNVQLICGILYIALLFNAAAATVVGANVLLSGPATPDPYVIVQFPRYGNLLLFFFGIRMAAMFVIATSNIGHSTGVLPRWFTILGLPISLVLLLSASFSRVLVVAFPVWLLILCSLLLIRARRLPQDQGSATGGGPLRSATQQPGGVL